MIFLRLRRVRMYAALFQKRRYMKNSDWQSLYFWHEIKLSEIRKLFACWQKWFYGIALLGTAKQVRGSMGNHTV